MSDYWRKLAPGADYPTLNARLNGLPDYLRKQNIQMPAHPQTPVYTQAQNQPQELPNWAKWIASFNQGIMEGVPFVKPTLKRFRETGILPESEKKVRDEMEKAAKEKPFANILGNIAGGIGATGAVPMVKPVVGGVGLAAKGILPAASRGAVNATTFAIPQAVSQGAETGKWGKAALSGLLGVGAGAIAGGAGGALEPLISKGWKNVRNWMTNRVLKAGGLRGKEVMKVLQNGIYGRKGFTVEKTMALKEQIADAISDNKLYNKQDALQFFDDKGKLWDMVDDAWKASGAKVDDFQSEVINHPDVLEWLTSPRIDPESQRAYAQYAQATLDDIFAKAASRKEPAAIRELLWTTMKNGLKDGTNLGQIKADVASALRDAIDNKFILPGLKEEYPALLALKKSFAWNEAAVAREWANSATAPRLFLKQLLTSASGPTVGAGYGVARWDPNDPKGSLARLAKGAAWGAAATVGGNILNRALQTGSTQLIGRLAGAARNVLPKEVPAALSGLGRIAQVAGEKAAPPAVAALTGPKGPETPAAAESPAEATVAQSEAQTTPEGVQAARDKVNTAYRDRVMQALQTDWQNTFAGPASELGITYDDFVQMVGSVTGGFG